MPSCLSIRLLYKDVGKLGPQCGVVKKNLEQQSEHRLFRSKKTLFLLAPEHFLSHCWCSGAFGTGTRQVLLLALMANEMAKQGTLKKHACKTPDTHGPSNPWYFLGIFQETSHFFW